MYNHKYKFFLFIIFHLVACKKFVDIPPPPTQIVSDKVFENDATATRAVTGIYTEMMNSNNQFSSCQMTFYAGMSADELYYYQADAKQEFLKNEITQNNHGIISTLFWIAAYKYIYAANACIEGLDKSQTLSLGVKTMLTGEAKFIRAYCYFYLINLLGDVPLIISTNYEVNAKMPRTEKAKVYDQIIDDLLSAQASLSSSYPTPERLRPNKWAATALLARIYLYKKEWQKAEAEATAVISSGSYSIVGNLNNVFLKGSNETIFQIQTSSSNINTWEGNVIIPASTSSVPTYLITNTLLNSFEANDQRKINWIQSRVYSGQTLYYPYKYKVQLNQTVSEYYVLLRLAEQYLIRAEARLHQNNLQEAKNDINIIRNRAGLPNVVANDAASLLLAVEQERKVELFSEWGHRWFDLIRTNRANMILGALKPATWQPTDTLWPIPSTQILLNPALTQNNGY